MQNSSGDPQDGIKALLFATHDLCKSVEYLLSGEEDIIIRLRETMITQLEHEARLSKIESKI